MLPLFLHRARDVNGVLKVNIRPTTTGIAASLSAGSGKQGWAMSDTDQKPYLEYTIAPVPVTAPRNQGIAFTTDGAMYVTADEISASSIRIGGFAVRSDGAVHVTAWSSTCTMSRGVSISENGRMVVDDLPAPFMVKFNDLGSGVVDTTVLQGVGSATFTRATEAACRLSTGLWKLDVASGVPRSHYHSDLTYGGFLQEPAAIQLALNPRDMTAVAWVAVNVTPLQDGTGMDGVANSCTRLTSAAIGGSIQQTVVGAASTRTYGVRIKRVTGTGTITINQGATTLDVTSSINSTDFTLVELPASVLNSAFGITFGASGDVILADCNQFEAGGAATTPIPAAGTRNQDLMLFTLTGNANAAMGACYAEARTKNVLSNKTLIGTGPTANIQPLKVNSTENTGIAINDGTTAVLKTGITNIGTGIRKRASSWGSTGLSVTGDGVAPATGVFDGAMPSSGLSIGNSTAGANATDLNGTIKNVKIWQQQLKDSVLQALTA